MNYKDEILKYCKSIGIDTVGFTECRIFNELKEKFIQRKEEGLQNEFEEEDIEKRINPFIYMKDGKTIISIAFPYLHDKNYNSKIYFSKYTLGCDYHEVLSKYLKKICDFIISLGGKAEWFVDSNPLPEKYIAYLSGLGFIGKNNLLITEKYGSFIFLGEIITDLKIKEDNPKESKCTNCDLCIKSCPVGAISQDRVNPNRCLSYITQKKEIELKWFDKLKGRIFGCDTCQNVCPYNKDIQLSNIKEFLPLEFMRDINYYDVLNMSKKEFAEKYKRCSCGWRGKNIIQRNLIINLFYLDKEYFKVKDLKINSPYVKKYYDILFKKNE